MPPKKDDKGKESKIVPFESFARQQARLQRKTLRSDDETDEQRNLWLAEVNAKWVSTYGVDATNELIGKADHPLTTNLKHQLECTAAVRPDEEAKAIYLEQLRSAPTPSQQQRAIVEGRFDNLVNLRKQMELIEAAVVMAHHFPNQSDVTHLVDSLKPAVITLQDNSAVGQEFRHIQVSFELLCLRTLLRRWANLDHSVRVKAGRATCYVTTPYRNLEAVRALQAAFSNESTLPTPENALALLEAAAKSIPLVFQSNVVLMKKRLPDANLVLATSYDKLPPFQEPSRATTPPTTTKPPPPPQPKVSVPNKAQAAVQPTTVASSSSGNSKTSPGAGNNTTTTSVGNNETIDVDDPFDFDAVLPPSKKKQKIDLGKLRGTVAAMEDTSNVTTPTGSGSAKKGAGDYIAASTKVIRSSTGGSGGGRASTHGYPCQSKYHERYSTDDKHASRDCPFCNVCHLMEFLFNGCRKDCVWQHKPTDRKIRLSLKRFPRVMQQGLNRFAEQNRGVVLDPIDLD